MSKYKYKTLAEVAKAFQLGELNKDEHQLFVDSDFSCIQWCGENPYKDEDSDKYWDYLTKKGKECEKLFRGNGYNDFLQALEVAGIPYEVD